jgi:hypothetical protein
MRLIIRVIEIIALAVWVGAMIAFAFLFAPIAFHTLGNLDEFALLVSHTITAVSYLGFGCAVIVAIAICASPRSRTRTARAVCLALMLGTSIYELYVIMPQMANILAHAGGSIAALAPHDPRRLAYDDAHHRSSLVYGVTLITGLVLLLLRAVDTGDAASAGFAPLRSSDVGLG